MKVLVLGRSYPEKKTGMIGIFELEQAKALQKYGHEVVYSFCDTRSIKSFRKCSYTKIKEDGILIYGRHLPIGGLPKKIFDKIKQRYYIILLEKIIEKKGIPDIIYVHFPLLVLNDGIWNFLEEINRPIIVTEHWSKVMTKELKKYYRKFLIKVVDNSDAFICVSEPLKKSVIELTSTTKEIRVVPNMVSKSFYYEDKETKTKNFEFISIGRLVDSKRFGLLMDAFTEAFENNENIYLKIIGNGPLFNKYKRKVEKLGMDHRILMTGFLSREETSRQLRNSNIFVSASVIETFGVPFIEAMTSGKPVIGIKNGSIDKYINESNGILFEKDNLNDLIKALKYAYKNRDGYDGENISKNAEKLFSEEAVIKELDQIAINSLKTYNLY